MGFKLLLSLIIFCSDALAGGTGVPRATSPEPAAKKKLTSRAAPRPQASAKRPGATGYLWRSSLRYGTSFLTMEQTGSLFTGDVKSNFYQVVTLATELTFPEWSLWLQDELTHFSYDSATTEGLENLHALELGMSRRWLRVSLVNRELPVFQKNVLAAELAKSSALLAALGARKGVVLPGRRRTSLHFEGSVLYPLAAGVLSSELGPSSVNGVGANFSTELRTRVHASRSLAVDLAVLAGGSYLDLSQRLRWGGQEGSVKTQILSLSGTIGGIVTFR